MAVQRWNDEMLDQMASSVTEVKESLTELKERLAEITDNINGLRLTAQALLQVAAQSQREMESMKEKQAENEQRFNAFLAEMELMKQRQAESDQQFNVLLQEVRYLIRGRQDG